MIGTMVGNYRILGRLGEGAMGAVYRGVDVMLDREVAIKALRPELSRQAALVERFRSEAIALARLNHPNVAMVHGLVQHEGELYMVMEFVEGETLEQILQHSGRMPWRRALELTAAATDGLQHAHEHGVVHRDIKPSNLMLTRRGVVKLMDFGVARLVDRNRQTRTGMAVGTRMYMSPEQLRGHDVDGRTDVYAMGAVLFELVTARMPFEAESEYDLLMAQLNDPPPAPSSLIPELPGSLDVIVARALEKRPEQRYGSAMELRRALLAALRREDEAPVRPVAAGRQPAESAAPEPAGAPPAATLATTVAASATRGEWWSGGPASAPAAASPGAPPTRLGDAEVPELASASPTRVAASDEAERSPAPPTRIVAAGASVPVPPMRIPSAVTAPAPPTGTGSTMPVPHPARSFDQRSAVAALRDWRSYLVAASVLVVASLGALALRRGRETPPAAAPIAGSAGAPERPSAAGEAARPASAPAQPASAPPGFRLPEMARLSEPAPPSGGPQAPPPARTPAPPPSGAPVGRGTRIVTQAPPSGDTERPGIDTSGLKVARTPPEASLPGPDQIASALQPFTTAVRTNVVAVVQRFYAAGGEGDASSLQQLLALMKEGGVDIEPERAASAQPAGGRAYVELNATARWRTPFGANRRRGIRLAAELELAGGEWRLASVRILGSGLK